MFLTVFLILSMTASAMDFAGSELADFAVKMGFAFVLPRVLPRVAQIVRHAGNWVQDRCEKIISNRIIKWQYSIQDAFNNCSSI